MNKKLYAIVTSTDEHRQEKNPSLDWCYSNFKSHKHGSHAQNYNSHTSDFHHLNRN